MSAPTFPVPLASLFPSFVSLSQTPPDSVVAGEPACTTWEGGRDGEQPLQGRQTRAGGAQSERHHQEEQRQTWQAAAATGK